MNRRRKELRRVQKVFPIEGNESGRKQDVMGPYTSSHLRLIRTLPADKLAASGPASHRDVESIINHQITRRQLYSFSFQLKQVFEALPPFSLPALGISWGFFVDS